MGKFFAANAGFGSVLALLLALMAAPAAAQDAATDNATAGGPGPSTKTHPAPLRPISGALDWLSDYAAPVDKAYDDYLAFKKSIKDEYHLDFSMDTTVYLQGATPHGGAPVYLFVFYPSLTWQPFTDTAYGSGEINVTYGQQTYWTGRNNASQAANLGLITLANDWLSTNFSWSTLAYTHTLPGSMSWLSFTIGQYNLFSFDPSVYAGNAQTTFISYSFAQDATQTFPNAGLGANLQAKTPDGQFTLAGGFQGGTNLSGRAISTRGIEEGKLVWWGNFQWAPKVPNLGDGLYSIMIYEQPSLPMVTNRSVGVSFSASQSFGEKWGAFLRVNNASGHDIPVETSANAGVVFNDPFHHKSSDQLGMALGWNSNDFTFNGVTHAQARSSEWVTELYYNYTLLKGLHLTPDVQVFINPALAPQNETAAVFTLRATIFF